MTYIKSFTVKGLAGRPQIISRTLDRHTNVIWGFNGTGKTTLLRLLAAALDNDTSVLNTLPFETAEVVFHSEHNDVDIVRSIDRRETPVTTARQPAGYNGYGSSLDYSEETDSVEAEQEYGERERWHSSFVQSSTDRPALTALEIPYRNRFLPNSRVTNPFEGYAAMDDLSPEDRFAWSVNTLWTQYSARSSESIREVQQLGLAKVLGILFGGAQNADATREDMRRPWLEGTPQAAYALVRQFLSSQDLDLTIGEDDFVARYNESTEHQEVVARISSVTEDIDAVLEPQRALQEVIGELYRGDKKLVLSSGRRRRATLDIQFGDRSIPVGSLSSGEKQLLQILLDTLAAHQATVMIDEPELSMHVQWQSRLIESMRRVNRESQFILATHSPDLMVGIAPDRIFEL